MRCWLFSMNYYGVEQNVVITYSFIVFLLRHYHTYIHTPYIYIYWMNARSAEANTVQPSVSFPVCSFVFHSFFPSYFSPVFRSLSVLFFFIVIFVLLLLHSSLMIVIVIKIFSRYWVQCLSVLCTTIFFLAIFCSSQKKFACAGPTNRKHSIFGRFFFVIHSLNDVGNQFIFSNSIKRPNAK